MSQKIENRDYPIPMWYVDLGPCSFWFQANSIDSVKGVDLGVNHGYANTSVGSVTGISFSDTYTHTHTHTNRHRHRHRHTHTHTHTYTHTHTHIHTLNTH